MKLYDTLSNQVQPFEPRGKEVSVYICGITPYDTTHIGHAFTYTASDILIRYLEMRGLKVKYVQNVTDIDDDILRKANEVGMGWQELGDRWTDHYVRDMQSLNVRPPDHFPRASEMIAEIIVSVRSLLQKGLAYQAGGSVYYSLDAWPEFGKLCRIPRPEMLSVANERGNRPDDPHKRDPLDFVLWQAQAPGEPYWESPWGPGRPGWHIECSTMASHFLGDTIDIHGGGADLCFPHHESEIAQIEPVTGEKPFVRYWLHTAMVNHDGEKMSKSLGNLVMVRDLLQNYSPDGLRVYLGKYHYRDSWTYNENELKKANKLAHKLLEAANASSGDRLPLSPDSAWAAFVHDMDNDLDTPGAIQVLETLADGIIEAALAGRDVEDAQDALRTFGKVFGLQLGTASEERVTKGWEAYLAEKRTA